MTSPRVSERAELTRLSLRGYKTIRQLENFAPGQLTVLIGPNGAGKSNLISFFRLLSWCMAPPGQLQEFVARQGGAAALLHDGPGQTRDIEAELCLSAPRGDNEYRFRLAYASGDTFIYTDEAFKFVKQSATGLLNWTMLGAGHRESRLVERAERGEKTPTAIQNFLRKIIIHQFHNTSDVARVRQKWDLEENRWLKEDAGNLAPFLLRLKHQGATYYHRIVETIRLALPFFADFELLPENGRVLLKWRERGSDLTFHAGQAADGMLRFLMLVALFAAARIGLT